MSIYQCVENLKLYNVLKFGLNRIKFELKIWNFSQNPNVRMSVRPSVCLSVCLRRSEIRTFCEPIELKFGMYVP